MWEGGIVRNPKPKSYFTLGMFALHAYKNSKPANVSEDRWNAMLKWHEQRKKEGISLREIIAMDEE